MTPLTINQKIKVFLDLLFSSSFCIILVLIGITLSILLIFSMYREKIKNILITTIYCITITLLIIKYHTLLFTIIDYLLETILTFIYFPNFALYIIVIITTNIYILLKNKKKFNLFTLLLLDLLFIIVLEIVYISNIDIYNSVTIYTDVSLLVIVEFSIGIWIIWLTINFLSLIIQKIEEKRKPILIFYD